MEFVDNGGGISIFFCFLILIWDVFGVGWLEFVESEVVEELEVGFSVKLS